MLLFEVRNPGERLECFETKKEERILDIILVIWYKTVLLISSEVFQIDCRKWKWFRTLSKKWDSSYASETWWFEAKRLILSTVEGCTDSEASHTVKLLLSCWCGTGLVNLTDLNYSYAIIWDLWRLQTKGSSATRLRMSHSYSVSPSAQDLPCPQ